MAKSHLLPYPTLISLIIIFLLPLSHSSIHDLMRSKGLPGGLFPKNIKNYHLGNDDILEVKMKEPCLAKFESRVFFDSVVRANLSYGRLIGVQGLSQEDLFLWLPVKDIIVHDPLSGVIIFDIGLAYKQFALSAFQEPPFCVPIGHNMIEEFGRDELKLRAGI